MTDIASIIDSLRREFALAPVVACEIEFYLHGSESAGLAQFWDEAKTRAAALDISIFKIEKERGFEQHEVALSPADAAKAARDCVALTAMIAEVAPAYGMKADFSAKPKADQPGSGLHVHVHLADGKGRNVFFKQDERISDELKFCIGGLLARAREDMPVFAPTADSRKRFVPGSNAPLTVSWGANNRTVAVRLPDSAHDNKRIEHRVAGSDAHPQKVIAAIMMGIYEGLRHKIEPPAQIYGDAALEMYGLPKLV